jgi:hypothetical protein
MRVRKIIDTQLEIGAGKDRVWQVLADFDSYARWNPMIRRASGRAVPGARLKVCFQPPGQARARIFRPVLTVVDPGRELRWNAGWSLPGFFGMEHYWTLSVLSDERTRLLHGVFFTGIAGVLAAAVLQRMISRAFEEMNLAHKDRAEQPAGTQTA